VEQRKCPSGACPSLCLSQWFIGFLDYPKKVTCSQFLPPYSPDLSPIELCWSKLKEIIRSAKARTIDALDAAITMAINAITDEDALNWFHHCGICFEPFR
jgi:transposase